MKIFIIAFVSSIALFLSSCDSVTDDKPLSVTTPSLIAPDDQSTVSVTPTFRWSGSSDKFEIATNSNFATKIVSINVTDSVYTLPSGYLESGKWYFWHAGKTTAGTIYWSSTFTFLTN